MNTEQIDSIRADAENNFISGYLCAESVVLALAKAQGIGSELLPKAATSFCGGMSRTCGSCGALTGAMMGLSLGLGRTDKEQSVIPAYTAVQQLVDEFEQAFGTRNCHELLGCDLGTDEGQAQFRDQQLGKQCTGYTGKAAEIAARILAEASND